MRVEEAGNKSRHNSAPVRTRSDEDVGLGAAEETSLLAVVDVMWMLASWSALPDATARVKAESFSLRLRICRHLDDGATNEVSFLPLGVCSFAWSI